MQMSNLSYNELKEAFEKTKKVKGEYSEMDILRPQPGDVVVAYFNFDEIDVEQAVEMHKALTQVIPEQVSVVTMPDACILLDYDEEHYIEEMFFQMRTNLKHDTYVEALRAELAKIDGDDCK